MKPFGRYKTVKGGNNWKIDYHIRRNGRKILNWWEDICCCLPRTTIKSIVRQYVKNELS